MSKRNQQVSTHPEKGARRADVRKDRYAARSLLASDPELAGSSVLIRKQRTAEPVPQVEPAPVRTQSFKHWKEPFWKRRGAERQKRNAALAALTATESSMIVLDEPDPIPKAAI